MPLKLYNTLSRKEETFTPINPPNVGMYVCGITPYDEAHLGHGRAYVTFDVIRRYLEYSGYKVNYIQNVTDIDDKIIKRSAELKTYWKELADRYTEEYFKVMDALGIKRADMYPKATEHIKVYFVTPDEDGTLTVKKPAKKGRAIVEVDTNGSYVLSETDIEESNKVKMFNKFIEDLKSLIKKNGGKN